MAQIFISYAQEDETAATQIAKMLERQGVSIWIDKKINIGQSWRKEIQQQLDAGNCIVVAILD